MEPFDPNRLKQALAQLTPAAQLAFALSCSERLFPNYLAFKRETGWGEPSVLREALDLAWSVLEGSPAPAERTAQLQDEVRQSEPETEDFDTILVSSALDAATSAGLVLRFVKEGSIDSVVEIASLCRDTVDMYLQELEGLDPLDVKLEQKILDHSLMQRELQRQQNDLFELKNFSGQGAEVSKLREMWRAPGQSNTDLSG